MAELTPQQKSFVRLFKWVIATYGTIRKPLTIEEQIPTRLVEILSVEGVNDLKVQVPEDLYVTLRHFRRLTQKNRLHAARRLWKEWSE